MLRPGPASPVVGVAEVECFLRVKATAATSAVEVLDASSLDSFAFCLMSGAVIALLRCTSALLVLGLMVGTQPGVRHTWATMDTAHVLGHIGSPPG
jgi:hypothetical protein